MIAILFTWALILIIFFSFGVFSLQIFEKIIKERNLSYSFVDVFFLGLCIVGIITCWISIWFPVNYILLICLTISSVIFWIFNLNFLKSKFIEFKRIIKEFSWGNIVVSILICYVILSYTLLPPLSYDVGLYHLQAMIWNETFGVVPGLANLHERLGFNSNYLLLCSTFSLKQLFNQPIFAIHSLCFVVFTLWLISIIYKMKSFLGKLGIFLFLFLFFYLYRFELSSPSTDLLPNILIAFLFLRLLFSPDILKKYPLIILIIPAYCVTLKLSAVPICLLSIPLIIQALKDKHFKTHFIVIFSYLLVLMPWLIRNYILSGYLIFPYPSIDLFNPDWKCPLEFAQQYKDYIYIWARMPGKEYSEILNLHFTEWFNIWFMNQKMINKVIFILCIASLFISLAILIKMKKKENNIKSDYFIILFVAFTGVLFWFITAPDFRFGYSFILFICFYPLMFIGKRDYGFVISNKIYSTLNFILSIGLLLYICNKYEVTGSLWLKPAPVCVIKDINQMNFITHTIDGVVIYTPLDCDQCYDKTIPCTPYLKDNLSLRGKSLKDGFRIKK